MNARGCFLERAAVASQLAVFEWFARQFGDFKRAYDLDDCLESLIADAAKVAPGSAGLIFLPYLQGERAPIWNANAKGVYSGINIKHEKQHFVRSTIEGILYAIYRINLIMLLLFCECFSVVKFIVTFVGWDTSMIRSFTLSFIVDLYILF